MHRSLRTQIQDNLAAAGREGDGVRAAKFAGQLDILSVILEMPEKELKKL